jgi:hypothetical protein
LCSYDPVISSANSYFAKPLSWQPSHFNGLPMHDELTLCDLFDID